MNFQIYILLGILFFPILLFLMKKRSFTVLHLQSILIPAIGILFIVCLLVFSKTAVTAASKGLQLWLNVVFPSLFPFFVGSEILNRTGVSKAAGIFLEPLMRPLFNVPGCGCFAFALGITSGYPMGAKITADLRKERQISKIEGERLLAFTNNSGPLFIAGAVAIGMFNKPQLGFLLLICHITAGILVGFLFRFYKRKQSHLKTHKEKNFLFRFKKEMHKSHQESVNANFGTILGESVKTSISLILSIGGFIIVFSVIINLLLETGIVSFLSKALLLALGPLGINQNLLAALVSGFFEITMGTSMASKAGGSLFIQQVSAAAMIIGWAGLSVHSQVYSIISTTDLSIKPYLLGKFLQGSLAAFLTYVSIKIAGTSLLENKPAFLPIQSKPLSDWTDYFSTACGNFTIALAILALCSFLAFILKRNIVKSR